MIERRILERVSEDLTHGVTAPTPLSFLPLTNLDIAPSPDGNEET